MRTVTVLSKLRRIRFVLPLLVLIGSANAAHLTRLDTWVGEDIKKVAIAFESGPKFVAVVKRANNRLKVFAFTTYGGQLAVLDELPLSATITEAKITYAPLDERDYFVVASRKTNGEMRLDLVEMLEDGTLELVDKVFPPIQNATNDFSLASLQKNNASRFVLAVRNVGGALDLRGFQHDGTQISYKTFEGGQSAKQLAVQMNGGAIKDRVIVALRNPANDLKVLVFTWDAPDWGDLRWAGNNVQSGYPAGEVGDVEMLNHPGDDIVTAVQDAQGRLKLIRWTEHCPYTGPADDECEIIRLEDGSAGAADDIQIAEAPNIKGRYLTSHTRNNGTLRVIAWHKTNGELQQVGNNAASNEPLGVAVKSALGFARSGRAVTALRDGQDRLRLILWHINW